MYQTTARKQTLELLKSERRYLGAGGHSPHLSNPHAPKLALSTVCTTLGNAAAKAAP